MVEIRKCEQIERVIELVYDPGVGADRDLRSHVSACTECSAEYGSLTSVAAAISEYKRMAFDPLPTPLVMTPESREAIAGKGRLQSWLEILRAGFGLKVAFATAMIVTLIGTVALFIGSGAGESQIAANSSYPAETGVASVSDREVSDPSARSNSPENATERPVLSPAVQPRGKGVVTRTKKNLRPKAPSPKQDRNETGLEEFADDSLRLADLLQQIGG